ncbi:MAG: hypothetical protein ABIJ56_19695 [Pseudomonadota bacterium]
MGDLYFGSSSKEKDGYSVISHDSTGLLLLAFFFGFGAFACFSVPISRPIDHLRA